MVTIGSELLIRVLPHLSAMAPSTALSFILVGTSLITGRTSRPEENRFSTTAQLLLAITGVLAIWNLAADRLAIFPQVDHLVFGVSFEADVAPATAFGFILVCAGALLQNSQARRCRLAATILATFGLFLTLTVLTAYAFDARALYAIHAFTAMALHTATGLAILFFTLLLRRPSNGWIAILKSPGTGSKSARLLLPFVTLVPFALCFIALISTRTGLITPNFRLSVLAVVMGTLLFAAILVAADRANKQELQIRQTVEHLQVVLNDKDVLLQEVYHRVKNNLQQIDAVIHLESFQITNPDVKVAVEQISKRISALSAVHNIIIAYPNPSRLRADEFLQKVCNSVFESWHNEPNDIDCEFKAVDAPLSVDNAIALGMIVSELLTNSLKHAFPLGGPGTVSVDLAFLSGMDARLTVSDAGTSLKCAERDIAGERSWFLRGPLRKLGASISQSTGPGLSVTVDIPGLFLKGD